MKRTYLIVGEAPSKDRSKKHLDVALACKSVQRRPVAGTMRWLDENHPLLFEFTMQTVHVNLLKQWPGPSPDGHGYDFPLDEGRDGAAEFVRDVATPSALSVEGVRFCQYRGRRFRVPDLVMLAGRRVARAFRMPRASEYFVIDPECKRVAGLPAVIVPHPSGINRWWNEPLNRRLAKGFLEGLGQ